MRSKTRLAATAGLLAALALLAGCTKVEEAKHKAKEPYKKEKIAGTDIYKVTLATSAADRLDLKTAKVTEARSKSGAIRKVIPYAALLYDLKGETFTYTSPEPLVFIRESVTVDYIDGERVFLLAGPKVGTLVVTAAGAELYGIEFGLGK